ncbi:hypothetical protein CEE44_02675 [Candidatus Woesearchaeota archaeon B3_Woes]|nr:MAG: hypothetical protein CEE44_02675 [Candidatus Woesearchaeota archaeon B3_Woes]
MPTLKQTLKGKLTRQELQLVPSSFDVVGSILIFSEFPKELERKEKIIAQSLIKELKNVKTICKKTRKYSGKHRTPKLKIMAGEKTKETIHKENNITLKLDVEKVYFSSRLSNERLRISKLIKPKENVLVMFSGCAPYPCVIAKNTKANSIIGIEINPVAHKYALENIKLNKITNTTLHKGDVNNILPKIDFEGIALKSRWHKKYIGPKLKQNPPLIEFYLPEGDLESDKKRKQMDKTIKKLAKKQIKVMIHSPHVYNKSREMYLAQHPAKIKNIIECIKKLDSVQKNNKNVVGHIFHSSDDRLKKDHKEEWLIKNIKTLKKLDLLKYLYLENGTTKPFGTKKSILNVIKKTQLKNMCFDFAHFMYLNKKLTLDDFKQINSKTKLYNHAVNHKYNSGEHCCRLREGDLDFRKFAKYIDFGCVEVYSKSEITAKEQIEDYKYFLSIKPTKKFDRILMPLPKSAEDYLDLALTRTKKGTIIHFYDFLNEKEFDLAKQKVEKACKKAEKKFKVLNLVKCGQFAPKTYRICLDFKILS